MPVSRLEDSSGRAGEFLVIRRLGWRGGKLHRDAEPAGGPGREGEGSVVCLGDVVDDCEAETDACVVGAYAFCAAKKRLAKRGNQLWVSFSPVFSTVSTALSG